MKPPHVPPFTVVGAALGRSVDVAHLKEIALQHEPVTHLHAKIARTPQDARDLARQAEDMARLVADALIHDLGLIADHCADVATLTLLPPGERDLLRRQGLAITDALQSIAAINGRGGR